MKLKSKSLATLLLSVCSISLITGCGDAKKEFDKAYDKSFIENWKSSFVSSCAKGDDRKLSFCNCLAEKSVASLSVDQLSNVDLIKERIVPQCK